MSNGSSAASDPNDPQFDRRPWGTFTVIDDEADYKVKRLSVDPGQRLSYQVHSHRAEHWTIVRGTARVTLDGIPFTLHAGDTISIPLGGAHRVENPGEDEMVFVEAAGDAPTCEPSSSTRRTFEARMASLIRV